METHVARLLLMNEETALSLAKSFFKGLQQHSSRLHARACAVFKGCVTRLPQNQHRNHRQALETATALGHIHFMTPKSDKKKRSLCFSCMTLIILVILLYSVLWTYLPQMKCYKKKEKKELECNPVAERLLFYNHRALPTVSPAPLGEKRKRKRKKNVRTDSAVHCARTGQHRELPALPSGAV